MLVQERQGTLRLIRQHDHALLAGELAAAWRGEERGERPDLRVVLATSLHDALWREADLRPRLDRSSGRPHDFTSFPEAEKTVMVEAGVQRLAAVEPGVAELVARHHRTLTEGTSEAAPDLSWLRFFDNLSLFVCLTPPGSVEAARPPWLSEKLRRPPSGTGLVTSWVDDDLLTLRPFPFEGEALRLRVRCRDIPGRSYRSDEELAEAWASAPEITWTVVLRASSGGRPGGARTEGEGAS